MLNIIKAHHRTISYTSLTLLAFAANSLLSRLALEQPSIDAASFSLIRLASGAIVLSLILLLSKRQEQTIRSYTLCGNWFSGWMLFLYVAGFTFAYLSLNTGTGALILFSTVQLTMLISAITSGVRPNYLEWLGFTLAVSGLVYLLLPGVETPSFLGSILMIIAGIAWGVYSILGQKVDSPLEATAGNFIRALPLALIVFIASFKHMHYSSLGILAAILSGGFASAIGYAMWYNVLKELSATRAAILQLLVPIIAATGGIIFLSESITFRFIIATLIIIGGVGLSILGRNS